MIGDVSVLNIASRKNDKGFLRHHSFFNDPTAGSPTVTLLRLLVPLNDQV